MNQMISRRVSIYPALQFGFIRINLNGKIGVMFFLCGMLPVEAIVDFRLLCVRWDKYSKPQSHQEYVCDYFRQNILTRGKNMEGFVPVCTGENGEDCALNFEDLLQKHPDLFQ